jgi:hypothetical protein
MIKMQNHYCYYLPSSLTGTTDTDCRKCHDQHGPLDIAPPLFQQMPEYFLDLMKECDQDIGFTSVVIFNKSDPNSASIRASTWAAYLNGTNRTNLQILDSATVLKVVFDKNELELYMNIKDNIHSYSNCLALVQKNDLNHLRLKL